MRSRCRACGQLFGGLSAFEAHRVGKFTSEPPHYGRRCLDVTSTPGWRLGRLGWTPFMGPVARGAHQGEAIGTDPLPTTGVAP